MQETFPYRVLLVDDDEDLLTTTSALLEQAGYMVRTARDGFEALASLRGSLPPFAVE